MRRIVLTATLLCATAGSVQAQSMNIPMILRETLDPVCGEWMRTGDRAAAVRAGQAAGYRAFDLRSEEPADADNPPGRILLDGNLRHRGQIVLIESRDRVCSIDLAEAGPDQISDLAAETLGAWGMSLVLDRGEAGVGVVVWAGEDLQAVIGPSVRSSGASLTLNWLRPD